MSQPAIDRRALITGRVLTRDRVVPPPGGEIASILVEPEFVARLPGPRQLQLIEDAELHHVAPAVELVGLLASS